MPTRGTERHAYSHQKAEVERVLGRGEPGIYNLAGAGEVRLSDIAKELGWHSVPIPKRAVDVTARIAGRIPLLALEAGWSEALRVPMLMDCARACQQLGWQAAYDGPQTLHELVVEHR